MNAKIMKENLDAKKYEKIIQMKEMQPSYLDDFILDSYKLPKISAIVTTYNRCPHSVEKDSNPLGWCLESLISQKGGNLDEIVIINDSSSDYTKEVVEDFQKKSSITLNYIKNPKNIGFAKSRNLGVKASKNNLLMFLDDDCIFSKYMFFGADYILSKMDENAAVMH